MFLAQIQASSWEEEKIFELVRVRNGVRPSKARGREYLSFLLQDLTLKPPYYSPKVLYNLSHWIKITFARQNPSQWIKKNSWLLLNKYLLFATQLVAFALGESRLANGRKSQKQKISQINVRRKPFPNIIAKLYSPTEIYFLDSQKYSETRFRLASIYKVSN